MEPKFKIGDVVKARFGGPNMTVIEVHTESESCDCMWWPKLEGGEWASKPESKRFGWKVLSVTEK